jgi:hypothetical protein
VNGCYCCDCSAGVSSMEDRSEAYLIDSHKGAKETAREDSVAREAGSLAIPFWYTMSPAPAL